MLEIPHARGVEGTVDELGPSKTAAVAKSGVLLKAGHSCIELRMGRRKYLCVEKKKKKFNGGEMAVRKGKAGLNQPGVTKPLLRPSHM